MEINEQKNIIREPSGYQLRLHEITSNQIGLKWGSYINPYDKVLSFHPGKPAIVSHFLLTESRTKDAKKESLLENQFVVFKEFPEPYDLYAAPTKEKERSFFELAMSDEFFNRLMTEESPFLEEFHTFTSNNTPSADFSAQMTPAMFSIIHDMRNIPYTGHLAGLYLEAKAVELFLMQIDQLDKPRPIRQSKLKPADIDALHEIRNYIASNYDQDLSITGLARIAGINQMKLKNGFKELFGATVFTYLHDIRMQKAKQMLLDEKRYVAEVSESIGYKHPHHFTAAFKKRFGMLPSELRD